MTKPATPNNSIETDAMPAWPLARAPLIANVRPLHCEATTGRHRVFLSADRNYMELAILEMAKCNESPGTIRVGCIVALKGEIIASGYKGQDGKNIHAEHAALASLRERSISAVGATIYSTLEPCVGTNAECSERIVNSGIAEVVLGSFDFNPTIRGKGYAYLKSKGVKLRGFDDDLRQRVDELNKNFVANFQRSTGPRNHCSFPYKENQNKSRLDLVFADIDNRSISIRCSSRDDNSVYLYADAPAVVARTHDVSDFSELHESVLSLFDFDYGAEVESNEIAVFKSPDGFALVKVSKIDRNVPVVHVRFEIRAFPGNSST